jgi:hypothetical protein
MEKGSRCSRRWLLLAYQIESNEIGADYLRAILTAEMLNNFAFYRPFIVSSEEEVPSEPVDELTALNTFLDINSQAGTWIDEITIVALANGLVRHGIIEGATFTISKERAKE